MTKLGEDIQVTIEETATGPMHMVYVNGVKMESIISTRVLDDPNSKFIPDGCVKLSIECFAVLVEKVEQ